MKIPRDVSAKLLIQQLKRLGYEISRQTGSHLRLTTQENGIHHITIPNHNPIKIGTLSAILKSIAEHFSSTKDEIAEKIFNERKP